VTSCQWEAEGKGNFFQAYATMFRQGYHIPKDKRSSNTVDNFRFHCTPPPFPNNLENKWTAAPRYESGTILVYVHQPRSGNPTGRHKSVRNSKLFSNIQQLGKYQWAEHKYHKITDFQHVIALFNHHSNPLW